MKKSSTTQSVGQGILTVIAGLVVAVLLQLGASQLVSAQQAPVNMDDVLEFITLPSTASVSRIGSLGIGAAAADLMFINGSDPNLSHWIQFNPNQFPRYRCLRRIGNIEGMKHSCLDVVGTGTFQKLWVMPDTLVRNVHVLTAAQYGALPPAGGDDGEGGFISHMLDAFIVEDIPGTNHDSMMISNLGRHAANGQFQPVNRTNRTDICATPNGTLRVCTGTVGPVHGLCGFAEGGQYATQPPAEVLCETGSASAVTQIGGTINPQWRWTCAGSGMGAQTMTCNAQRG